MGSQDILQLGKASIFSSFPEWLPVKVGPNYNGVTGPANKIADTPVPTNKWFSPLFWWVHDLDIETKPVGAPLRPMPALFQMYTWGLMLAYRHNPEFSGNEGWPDGKSPMNCSDHTYWKFDSSPNTNFAAMVISVDKLLVDKQKTPFFVKASAFGDWDATMEWDDGERRLQLTGLAGSPMLYGTASGGELEFQLPFGDQQHPITFYDGQGKSLGEAYNGANPGPNLSGYKDGVLGLALKTKYDETVYYAIYAPRGTEWSYTQRGNPPHPPPRGGNLSSLKSTNLAAGKQPIHFTVAVLPLPPQGTDFPLNALKAFADAAGFHVAGTVFTWDGWDASKSTITAHYDFPLTAHTGELPSEKPSVLTTLFKPHQALIDGSDGTVEYVLGEDNKPYSYNSPRGPLKLVRLPVNAAADNARYSVTYPYYGYVPALPDQQLSGEELSHLKTYLSADSRQSSAATTDFLDDQQPDAYAAGTKLYYKLMQTVYWLQQLQQLDSIPDFRHKNQTASRQEAIDVLVSFLKADLETFFSATRPGNSAYQWHFIAPDEQHANDVYGFTKTAQSQIPQIFPCSTDPKNTICNPGGDPLLEGEGVCWKLTQQDLIDAQAAKKNPYLVLRGLDFTVNDFAKTGPGTDMLFHFAWKQQRTDLQTPNINLYAFYAPTSQKADPGKPEDWKQCVWTDEAGEGNLKLLVHNNVGIGNPLFNVDEPWRVGNLPYNGTADYAPHRLAADKYDIMLVFDCGADCGNFPGMCGVPPTTPPDVSAEVWKGWEVTFGPVHFQGKPYKFITYDTVWNTLLGNVTWYGSIENLSDHHFGWGYLIKAAALVAQFDSGVEPDTQKPWWDIEKGWGAIVNLMIRDVMDWRKPGEADPHNLKFVRCKYLNPVEGHMYADGSGNSGDGNNEESSSEAINFANACIEWGAVTGQDDIRDMGILLRSMYAQAVPIYWFNVDGDVLPSTTADKPFPVAAQLMGSGNKHDTFFSHGTFDVGCPSRNSDVVAIETLPVSAETLRLTLFAPQLKVAWETVMNAGGPYCGETAKCYLSTLLSFQALVDAASAKASFLQRASPEQPFTSWYNYASSGGLKQPEDHSYATTYAFILGVERLKAAKAECVASPDSNPFYMSLADGSVLIYNPTSAARSYRIGGASVTVPPLRCLRVDAAGNVVDSH